MLWSEPSIKMNSWKQQQQQQKQIILSSILLYHYYTVEVAFFPVVNRRLKQLMLSFIFSLVNSPYNFEEISNFKIISLCSITITALMRWEENKIIFHSCFRKGSKTKTTKISRFSILLQLFRFSKKTCSFTFIPN